MRCRGFSLALLLGAATLAGAPALCAAEPTGSKQGTAQPPDLEAKRREYFSDVRLTVHDGREVRFYSDLLKDKVVLIHFFYTNCKTTAALQAKVLSDLQPLLGERLGRDIFIISLTVDPTVDSADKVREYAKAFRPRQGWTFLTGKKVNVDWVNYRLGNYTEKPELHSPLFLLGNLRTGHWIKDIPETKSKVLAEHLNELVAEKGRQ
jgi:protein SCO1